MSICPSCKHLRSARNEDASDSEGFHPDIFHMIEDERIAKIKAIRANTPFLVSTRLLICQKYKNHPINYCACLCDPLAEKKACESNKTDYVYFFIDESKYETGINVSAGPAYLMVFTRHTKNNEEISKIITEVKNTTEWLDITGSTILCYIFYYSPGFLCNTMDRGSFTNKFNELCDNKDYIFQFQYIPPHEKPRWLCINGGSPKFTIEVQDMLADQALPC